MKTEITFTDNSQGFFVKLDKEISNPRRLNAALGVRLQDELKDYFFLRNTQPNKRGWEKQNWWAGVADATQLTEVNEAGATVTIAHREGFAIRARGGDIRAREAKNLTIPLIEAAYGKSVAEFRQSTGHKLFRPAGARYLAFTDDGGESITPAYFLTPKVTIPKDDAALPDSDALASALVEEAEDYLGRTILS